jgi:hypothetical protein
MVHTWNQLVPTTPNLFFGMSNNIPPGEVDFESAALHELGHCIGLGHPNLATESGLPEPDRNYTQSTDGVNNVLEISSGGDGIRGSADDVRGDDVNLHWFRKSNNNPFTIAPTVDAATYGRPLTGLPGGHLFAANADRDVGAALGFPDTEAVMQQGQFIDEDQRALNHDDVATLALGMSGIDLTAGTADDYTLTLSYAGLTTGCDVVLDFDNGQTGFAVCAVGGAFITGSHIRITSANIYFNTGFSWFFNPVLTAPPTTSTTSSTTTTGPTTSTTTTTLGSLVEHPQDALKIILKENTTTGKEKAVWVSKVPPIVLPSSDPTAVGASFRV